ncbi:MAG: energy transducer TonB, partial [Chloroflexi bacterium]
MVPPRVIERVEAAYPDEARNQGLTATVVIRLVIGADGLVSSASLVKGAGHGFDESALEAARKLRFAPATRDGTAVPVQIDYEIHFELTDAPAATLSDTARATS